MTWRAKGANRMAANPQMNSRHELNGSDEGGPEHWPNILLIIFSSNCQEDVS